MTTRDRHNLIAAWQAVQHARADLDQAMSRLARAERKLLELVAPDADLDQPGTSRPDVIAAGLAVPADDELVDLSTSAELEGPEGWRQRHYARKGGTDATPL